MAQVGECGATALCVVDDDASWMTQRGGELQRAIVSGKRRSFSLLAMMGSVLRRMSLKAGGEGKAKIELGAANVLLAGLASRHLER